MMRALVWLLVIGFSAASSLRAQDREVWTLSGDSGEVPGEARELDGNQVAGRPVQRLTDVTTPTLEIFPADPARATDTAVIVCPGGGYRILAYDLEGTEVAAWLQGLGVTALVLKYRVPAADNEPRGQRPLEDLRKALQLVRSRADELNIDPQKVGVLGFSAGGHLAVQSAVHHGSDNASGEGTSSEDSRAAMNERPNFLIPIYPAYLVDAEAERPQLDPSLRIDGQTPPTFMVVTQDDADRAIGAALMMIELKRNEVPAELHVFVRGGHGYGLRVSQDAVSRWPELCERWMRAMGFL